MKPLCFFIALFFSFQSFAQSYALLDKNMISPAKYSKTFSPQDRAKGYFPIEKKHLTEFINTLKKIEKDLASKNRLNKVSDYQVGCVSFKGQVLNLDKGDKVDYVLTSNCAETNTVLHLVDLKLTKETNLYFIRTWIKYIQSIK